MVSFICKAGLKSSFEIYTEKNKRDFLSFLSSEMSQIYNSQKINIIYNILIISTIKVL